MSALGTRLARLRRYASRSSRGATSPRVSVAQERYADMLSHNPQPRVYDLGRHGRVIPEEDSGMHIAPHRIWTPADVGQRRLDAARGREAERDALDADPRLVSGYSPAQLAMLHATEADDKAAIRAGRWWS